MNFYHVTRPEYVLSILQLGLIPNFKRGLSCGKPRATVIWLTDNPDYIIKTQVGDCFKTSIILIQNPLDVKCWFNYHMGFPKIALHEFITEHQIKPESCKLI